MARRERRERRERGERRVPRQANATYERAVTFVAAVLSVAMVGAAAYVMRDPLFKIIFAPLVFLTPMGWFALASAGGAPRCANLSAWECYWTMPSH